MKAIDYEEIGSPEIFELKTHRCLEKGHFKEKVGILLK